MWWRKASTSASIDLLRNALIENLHYQQLDRLG
jgi:hypothetical protein